MAATATKTAPKTEAPPQPAAAAPAAPPLPKRYSDVWFWCGWAFNPSLRGNVEPAAGMLALCQAAGSWRDLKALLAKPEQLPVAVLTAMRLVMQIRPNDAEIPFETAWNPEQSWVDAQVREFCKWYLAGDAEPKPDFGAPAKATSGMEARPAGGG